MRTVRFVVGTAGDPLTLARAIRSEIRALDPNLLVAEVVPLERLVTTSLARPRFYTALLALFAVVARALGARGGDVLRMIVGRALGLAAGGLTSDYLRYIPTQTNRTSAIANANSAPPRNVARKERPRPRPSRHCP